VSGFSEWGGRIARDPAYPTSDHPIGPVVARDFAINNANHYCDIHGQVRARMVARTGEWREGIGTSKIWFPMWAVHNVSIALRPDGSSYRLRLRLNASAENAGFECFFAVSVQSATGFLYPAGAATDAVWTTGSITATTPAWLTGASTGTNAYTTQIGLSPAEASACARTTATLTDVAGDRIAVTHALCSIYVWSYADSSSHQPRLYAFSAEEWPG
jgi:hypothetical protein